MKGDTMRVKSRNERLDRIVAVMSGAGQVTLREIARLQNLQVTPYLKDCVLQLVLDGHVDQSELEGVYPKTHQYTLTEGGERLAGLILKLYEGE